MSTKNQLRPCNLCGETDFIQGLYARNGYEIVRCRTCNLVYVDRLPAQETLSKLYDQGFFTIGSKYASENPPAGRANAQKRINYIRNLNGLQLNAWLDVGCATGDFLLAIRNVAADAYGIDISDFAIHAARRRGLEHVYAADFASLQMPEFEGRFDVITMWDFIEHTADPMLALRRARGYLKPDGYLILSTGDIRALAGRLMGKYWHLMIPPKHTYFFSAGTMRRYLAELGFTDIRISYPGKWVPLDFVCYKGLSLLNRGFAERSAHWLAGTGLGRLAVPINLFDIMTVSARRPDQTDAQGVSP